MTKRKQVRLISGIILLFALVLAAGCGGDKTAIGGGESTKAADSGVTVELANFTFAPATITVKAGTTVTFVNKDQIAHDVVQATVEQANKGEYGFQSPQINPKSSWSHTFDKPGTYPVLCTVGSHYLIGMVGTIIVE